MSARGAAHAVAVELLVQLRRSYVHVPLEGLPAELAYQVHLQSSVEGLVKPGLVGLEVVYGGEDAYFSSLRTKDGTDPILSLEQGKPVLQWGRLIFRVSDVDLFWAYLIERGLRPESPRDASWGERYFHLWDPDGHELSFAHPIKP